ncbi:hypothetical protein ACSZNX_15130 [Aeromonas veronii]|uniref:hypothetical protein n=1 Tax=Aeromonas veronii TaxID=654 RepID=UPI00111B952B|nr:hypothetical protein [Aeromonas veronii]
MNKNLEELLRKQCSLIGWWPTQQQIAAIENEINKAIASGKKLSKSDCQHIVVKHCGKTRMVACCSVDNSDLNTLLALAIRKDSAKS